MKDYKRPELEIEEFELVEDLTVVSKGGGDIDDGWE